MERIEACIGRSSAVANRHKAYKIKMGRGGPPHFNLQLGSIFESLVKTFSFLFI